MHAAGNESENLDNTSQFPSRYYKNKKVAPNWMEIGASSWGKDSSVWWRHFPTTEKRALTYLRPALKSIQQRRIMSMKICKEPASLVLLPVV